MARKTKSKKVKRAAKPKRQTFAQRASGKRLVEESAIVAMRKKHVAETKLASVSPKKKVEKEAKLPPAILFTTHMESVLTARARRDALVVWVQEARKMAAHDKLNVERVDALFKRSPDKKMAKRYDSLLVAYQSHRAESAELLESLECALEYAQALVPAQNVLIKAARKVQEEKPKSDARIQRKAARAERAKAKRVAKQTETPSTPEVTAMKSLDDMRRNALSLPPQHNPANNGVLSEKGQETFTDIPA